VIFNLLLNENSIVDSMIICRSSQYTILRVLVQPNVLGDSTYIHVYCSIAARDWMKYVETESCLTVVW